MDYCCSFFTIVFTMCLYGQHVLYSLPCETTFAFDLDDFLYRLSFFSPDRRRGQKSWKMKTKRKARENRCPFSRRWTRPSGCTGRQRTTTALNAKRGHARTLTAKARCSWQPRRRLRITATPQERRAEQPGTRRGERKKKPSPKSHRGRGTLNIRRRRISRKSRTGEVLSRSRDSCG